MAAKGSLRRRRSGRVTIYCAAMEWPLPLHLVRNRGACVRPLSAQHVADAATASGFCEDAIRAFCYNSSARRREKTIF